MEIEILSDDDGYCAKTPDLPMLYGCGETEHEAVIMLKREILSLRDDLIDDDNLTQEWLEIREQVVRIAEELKAEIRNCLTCAHAPPLENWESGITSRGKPFKQMICPRLCLHAWRRKPSPLIIRWRDGRLFKKHDQNFTDCFAHSPKK